MKNFYLLFLLCVSFSANAQIKDLKKMVKEAETNTYDYDSVKTELTSLLNRFNTDIPYFEQNKSAWVPRSELRNRTTLLKSMSYNYITADKVRGPYLVLEWDMFTPANVWMRNNMEKMLDELLLTAQYRKEVCGSMYPPCSKIYYNASNERAYIINNEKGGSFFFTLFKHGYSKDLYTAYASADSLNALVTLDKMVAIYETVFANDSFSLISKYKATTCSGKPVTKDNQYIFTDCAKENKVTTDAANKKSKYAIIVIGINLTSCDVLYTNLNQAPAELRRDVFKLDSDNAELLKKHNISTWNVTLLTDGWDISGIAVLAQKANAPAYVLVFKKPDTK